MTTTNMTNEQWLETLEKMMIDMPKLNMAHTCYDYLVKQGIPPTDSQKDKLFKFWNQKSQANQDAEVVTNSKLKETAIVMEQLRKEKYADADIDVLDFCRDFEHRVATTPFTPNKDELFDYYFQKRKLNVGFSVPNKWVGEFMQYCVGR